MKKTIGVVLGGVILLCVLLLNAQTAAKNGRFICPPCGMDCDNAIFDKPGHCPSCNVQLVPKSSIKNVAIFLYDGVEILDFSGPSEVFASSHSDSASFRVYTVAASKDPIMSQGFVRILPEFDLGDCPQPDIIVLPGGNSTPSVNNPKVIEWVQKHAAHADALMSVCTGAFILEKAGLLVDKKATTFHNAIDNLRKKAPQTEVLENVRWVDNGQIVTTAGVSAGIDGALHVVERMMGRETAVATARYMEYDKWKPEDGVVVEKKQ